MSAKAWKRALEVVALVEERELEEREQIIEAECGDDSTLKTYVRELLAELWAIDQSEGVDDSDFMIPVHPGEILGPYQVLKLLGSGGMGEVFLALRIDDERLRTDAVKILPGDLMTLDRLARAVREAEIVQDLQGEHFPEYRDHGTLTDGRPFLAMEFIDGLPIDQHCQKYELSLRDRLRLFKKVCSAISLAHQALVLHRDLKPANVLVTSDGVPKILDFGIAKALDPEGTATRTLTVVSAAHFTPNYASPEQLEGTRLTIASDVYSLGVLLYELVTGKPPIDLSEVPLSAPALLKKVLETDPVPPSAAVRGETAPGFIDRDLDAIALKVLSKKQEERYASVDYLASDINNYLTGHPVQAQRATPIYRARKFIRRHWFGLSVVAAFVLLSLGFGLAMAWQQQRTARERDLAEQTRQLLVDTFTMANPSEAQGATITAKEILERGAAKVRSGMDLEPALRASLLKTVTSALMGLGLFSDAFPLRQEAAQLYESIYGPEHIETAGALLDLGEILILRSQYSEAKANLETALEVFERELPENHRHIVSARLGIGAIYYYQGNYELAEKELRHTVALIQSQTSPDPEQMTEGLTALAAALLVQAKYNDAEPLFRESLRILEENFGIRHPRTVMALSNLGWFYSRQEKLEEAELYYQRSLDIRKEILPSSHAGIAISLNNLASVLEKKGEKEKAEKLFKEALTIFIESYGREHPNVGTALNNLGLFLLNQGDYIEAEDLLRQALDIRKRVLGPDHPEVAHTINNIASIMQAQKRYKEADELYRESLRIRLAKWGGDHPEVAKATNNLARLYADMGDRKKAHKLYKDAVEMWLRVEGPDHIEVAVTLRNRALLYLQEEKVAEAENLLRRALSIATSALPPGHAWTEETRVLLERSAKAPVDNENSGSDS